VKTQELKAVREYRAPVVHRGMLTTYQGLIKRMAALGIYAVSFAGSLLWGGGGVDAWLSLTPNVAGIIGALILQGVCTAVQWTFGGSNWYNPWYVGSVMLSGGSSLAGYWPVIYPWLVGVLLALFDGGAIAVYAPWIAGALMVVAMLLADVLPERILIQE
jgi:hypothetical protein